MLNDWAKSYLDHEPDVDPALPFRASIWIGVSETVAFKIEHRFPTREAGSAWCKRIDHDLANCTFEMTVDLKTKVLNVDLPK